VSYLVGKLLKAENLPKEEENFQKAYVKAPSFLSIHMGVKADVLPPDTDCHHFVLEVLCTSIDLLFIFSSLMFPFMIPLFYRMIGQIWRNHMEVYS